MSKCIWRPNHIEIVRTVLWAGVDDEPNRAVKTSKSLIRIRPMMTTRTDRTSWSTQTKKRRVMMRMKILKTMMWLKMIDDCGTTRSDRSEKFEDRKIEWDIDRRTEVRSAAVFDRRALEFRRETGTYDCRTHRPVEIRAQQLTKTKKIQLSYRKWWACPAVTAVLMPVAVRWPDVKDSASDRNHKKAAAADPARPDGKRHWICNRWRHIVLKIDYDYYFISFHLFSVESINYHNLEQ